MQGAIMNRVQAALFAQAQQSIEDHLADARSILHEADEAVPKAYKCKLSLALGTYFMAMD